MPAEPTVEDMKKVVVEQQKRPFVPNRWSENSVSYPFSYFFNSLFYGFVALHLVSIYRLVSVVLRFILHVHTIHCKKKHVFNPQPLLKFYHAVVGITRRVCISLIAGVISLHVFVVLARDSASVFNSGVHPRQEFTVIEKLL